jgi:regulator of protease activity HflC (stomatin/prohibitin superfamily)
MGIHPITLLFFFVLLAAGGAAAVGLQNPPLALGLSFLAVVILIAFRVARQWQKAVVLRLGKFDGLRGPGLFWIIPGLDTIPFWIDLRTVTTPFTAERTLTKDSVPVDVDAVLFWRVVDPEKAALEVEDYRQAISWACQTALRDAIGETDLAKMLVGRQEIDKGLEKLIESRTSAWGIQVLSVEIRDVKIPEGLQNAMSMQAQAERERQARVILGESELQIATKFKQAASSYEENPVALHLRGMNMLLEGMKHGSTVVIVPSSAVETMGLGAMSGLTALAKEFGDGGKSKAPVVTQGKP